ncbi:conserved protein of unknown function (plasmid) [Cupriavidus taiwanensis]|uniref:Uncharacterized protein n=1 Tax=Cupriavidus taiwanensis TaxID=164546 RepID=A0A7Z7JI99_9BURK|nr:hypothetical protein CBM2597_U30031 [Cupriavidus taiwanensis]SOZ96973.1 hypothetical protein CBM2598_U30032 [Cupriavidus taiwanensis]SPC25948.1 hypothetical protein CBM2594_U20135 [Cupriavidus taiwanensis]SPD38025.1 conserved protein of unknown function [Cupriavidus taiwanensis]
MRRPPFDLPHDVLVVVLFGLAAILVMLGLFAWYVRRRHGPASRMRNPRGAASRKRNRKSTRRRK